MKLKIFIQIKIFMGKVSDLYFSQSNSASFRIRISSQCFVSVLYSDPDCMQNTKKKSQLLNYFYDYCGLEREVPVSF